MADEKEALRTAYLEGILNSKLDMKTAEEYMNEMYQL
jgi:hypothetical protein